jgi:hypothetical protein
LLPAELRYAQTSTQFIELIFLQKIIMPMRCPQKLNLENQSMILRRALCGEITIS